MGENNNKYIKKTIMAEQLDSKIIKLLNENADKLTNSKSNFFSKLLDKNNENVSTTNFFVIVTTIIGLVLLGVPVIVLLMEVWYNHTITTDLSGMAEYIAAVAGMFASVGITKAWTSYSDNKAKSAKYKALCDSGSLEYINNEFNNEFNNEYNVYNEDNDNQGNTFNI